MKKNVTDKEILKAGRTFLKAYVALKAGEHDVAAHLFASLEGSAGFDQITTGVAHALTAAQTISNKPRGSRQHMIKASDTFVDMDDFEMDEEGDEDFEEDDVDMDDYEDEDEDFEMDEEGDDEDFEDDDDVDMDDYDDTDADDFEEEDDKEDEEVNIPASVSKFLDL